MVVLVVVVELVEVLAPGSVEALDGPAGLDVGVVVEPEAIDVVGPAGVVVVVDPGTLVPRPRNAGGRHDAVGRARNAGGRHDAGGRGDDR